MAQRKQLTWTELRVGLFVLVGLSAGVGWALLLGVETTTASDAHRSARREAKPRIQTPGTA